jgi:serine protease AprX
MRHRCSVHTALVWLLGVGLFATAAAVPGGAQGGIAPSVEQWLREAAAGERVATWVFLRDKGARSADDVERDLRRVASAVDPAALERRLRARPETPFDQADLPLYKPYLEALEAEGVSFRAFSRWLNAVSIEADRDQVERVAGLPFVKGVRRVSGRAGGPRTELVDLSAKEMTPLYDYGFAWTQLDQIQIPALHSEGYTGSGVRVALLDTGFWLEHETFSNLNLIAQHDFINDDDTTANQPGDPPGQHDHGTMCLSLLAGQSPGIMMGGAFDAEYILAKTENIADEQPIEEDWWIEALEWADSLGAQLVSSSLCYTDWYTYEDMDGDTAPITNAADQGAINGIVIVNAAGNAGASEWLPLTVTASSPWARWTRWASGPLSPRRARPTTAASNQP